ncbi:MAG: YigZ family protein [Fusicatenibacter sp.]|nr:YigZ family protein [Fusicatenibacter sp.]
MIERYKTIYIGGEGELIEKKSRFIATVRLVESEEEALQILEALRKKYWNATHNCFAYVIGEKKETVRCSDDGEPSGTAGRPMLDVLLGEEICNVLVVVTRYFGGTLLGTGGLVRAYSQAVCAGLAESTIIEKIYGVRMQIQTDYNGIGKIQYLLGKKKIPILRAEYTDQVMTEVMVPADEEKGLQAEITEVTNGRAKMEIEEKLYFAVNEGELIYHDALTRYKNLGA